MFGNENFDACAACAGAHRNFGLLKSCLTFCYLTCSVRSKQNSTLTLMEIGDGKKNMEIGDAIKNRVMGEGIKNMDIRMDQIFGNRCLTWRVLRMC